jgi:hypothetical protein
MDQKPVQIGNLLYLKKKISLSLHGSVKGIGRGDLLENDFRMKFNKIYHCANVQKDKKSSTAEQYRESVKNILKNIYGIF